MAEESKTYVFGQDGANSALPWALAGNNFGGLIQGDLVADGEHDDGVAGLAVGLCHAVVANDVVVGI